MRPGGTFDVNYKTDMAIIRTRFQWVLTIAALILVFVFPLFGNVYLIALANYMAIAIIAVLGLNILTGYCGQISIGQAGFMAAGAYTSAILSTKLGLSFWLCLPCAGISAALFGLIFGIASLRVKGLYLAMGTIAAHLIILWILIHIPGLTGGTAGTAAEPPVLGGIVFDSDRSMYFIIMAALIIMTFFAKNLMRTRIGRAFIAIRDNDLAAEVMGINLFGYKLLAFAISCFYAGVAGSLMAHWLRMVSTLQFPLWDSIWFLGMVVIGGMGSISGCFFGVIFLGGLQELTVWASPMLTAAFPAIGAAFFSCLGYIIMGLAMVLFIIFEPRGLAHRWEITKASSRLWPFSY